MKFYSYLNEKLIDIDQSDIDLIFKPMKKYAEYFDELMNEIAQEIDNPESNLYGTYRDAHDWVISKFKKISHGIDLDKFYRNRKLLKTFKSDELKSAYCISAHKIKPIKIEVYNHVKNNAYIPLSDTIHIGINIGYIEYLIRSIKNIILEDQFSRFRFEFNPVRLRTSIRHELTHWIDDCLHNMYLTNLITRTSKTDNKLKMLLQGKSILNLTDREINAIVNQVDHMRKELGKIIWDQLSWDDLETLISTVYSKTYSPKDSYEFRKKLKKRMAREKILGKNMR